MLIREVRESDIAALSVLAKETYTDAFGDSMTPYELAAELEDERSETYFHKILKSDTILIAEDDSGLIGYVQFGDVRIPEAEADETNQELHRIYIKTDLQGQGIGRKLMTAALAHERLALAQNIYLQVWDQNPRALTLYESLGFEIVGKTDVMIRAKVVGQDLVMLKKNL